MTTPRALRVARFSSPTYSCFKQYMNKGQRVIVDNPEMSPDYLWRGQVIDRKFDPKKRTLKYTVKLAPFSYNVYLYEKEIDPRKYKYQAGIAYATEDQLSIDKNWREGIDPRIRRRAI